ncbi:MAG: fused MFS/spermidine synthase [Pyrinomonadaceae bacterium]
MNQTNESRSTSIYLGKTSIIIGVCFVLSGATGLIYEVLWARMLGLVFGATTFAISTVLAAFMGGLALGSALSGRYAKQLRNPLRAYGSLEIGIAIYALLVPLLFRLVDWLYAALWSQVQAGFFVFSLWRFLLASAVLLIPTALMGATLPILSSAILRSDRSGPTAITGLYNCNLIGAIAGALVAGFFLLPEFGVKATIWTAAAINLLIGSTALYLESRSPSWKVVDQPINIPESVSPIASSSNAAADSRFWWWCALTSGFVTIGVQVAWSRILTMVIGSSTYAFSLVVALFLTGLSIGALWVARRGRIVELRRAIFRAELAAAAALFLSLWVVNFMPNLLIDLGIRLHLANWWALLALQSGIAALLILIPATLMGLVMPLVLVWANERGEQYAVGRVGRLYAANTLGAIVGAVLAGFVFIPQLGVRLTILFAVAICLVIAAVARPVKAGKLDADMQRAVALGLAVTMIVALPFVGPRLNLAMLSVGAYDGLVRVLAGTRFGGDTTSQQGRAISFKLLAYYEGPTATVSVSESEGARFLAINGRTNASDKLDMPTQVMVGQLPLLIAPRTDNALTIGYASGVTVGALLQSDIKSLECVELEPRAIDAGHFFDHVNHRPFEDPRLRLTVDDARAFLRVTPTRYDIIVSEPSHPWVPGVANLFTREFFQLGRSRLNPDGVFVQWLQVYQISTESLRTVLATFHETFPNVLIFRVGGNRSSKDLILLGSQQPLNLNAIESRLANPQIAAELARINVVGRAGVEGWYVCDQEQLGPAVAGAIINTDDNMRVETRAPREAFLPLMESNTAWIETLANQAKLKQPAP